MAGRAGLNRHIRRKVPSRDGDGAGTAFEVDGAASTR